MKRSRILLFAVLGLAACAVAGVGLLGAAALLRPRAEEPPGEGAKAERGYAACAPVIAALEDYRAARGAYPAALDELAPAYLPQPPGEVNGWPIEYRLTEQSYSLEFSYTGPGMNHCSYTPEAGWHCYGYY